MTELLWFLRGESNIQSLVKDGNYIWVGDSYKFYQNYHNNHPTIHSNRFDILSRTDFIEKIKTDDEFAKQWGEMGPIYGKQWRNWSDIGGIDIQNASEDGKNWSGECWGGEGDKVDQISNLINDLKNNPDSRRLMVSAWNVAEIPSMKLPPCHYGFQLYTRLLTEKEKQVWAGKNLIEKPNIPEREISLMWQQRSVDTPLGSPFNIASYGLLLEILAKEVNMIPGELIGNFGDTHIYRNQLDGVKEQLKRDIHDLPTLTISEDFYKTKLEDLTYDMFKLNDYTSGDKIFFPLSN